MSEIGQKLIEETRKVAAEYPDFIFKDICRYVNDGKPGCIVGHALWNLGMVDETTEGKGFNDDGIWGLDKYLNLNLDPYEYTWLRAAQDEQDTGAPWGKAVAAADEVAAREDLYTRDLLDCERRDCEHDE
ncbi:hypothetical protein DQP57_00565 [Mycobacterium colombiense]|uniref:Uncharacterized protein n=1 Tax=Mycobacterium colombiense TaxID=339268 RepID=A0A329MCI7_9MYCO|nr:hypothetical protein [Mycobacterium colombiense]RAV17550.1 hypothetical protein DQP57_00565 [Mycobacterium colombiense]